MSFDELISRAQRDVDQGLLPSCQLALARDGKLVLFETLGDATDDTRYTIFSVTKGLVASAVWLLVSEGALSYQTRVADLVPGFEANGKGAVTVDHLLLHTAGFPRAPMRPEEGAEPDRRLERFCSWRLDWEAGTRTAYHPTSAHWVLADVVERASGRNYRTFVNERISAPLKLDSLRLGVPADRHDGIAELTIVGEPAQLGTIRRESGEEFTVPEIRGDILLRYNEPAVRAAGVPGAGAIGTAADVAMLFQAFMREDGEVWDEQVLADATLKIRNRFPDPYTNVPANRTRGLVAAGDDGYAVMRGFGDGASAVAFASPGVGGQTAWADSATGVSFCFLTNGIDADLVRAFRRSMSLSTRAAKAR